MTIIGAVCSAVPEARLSIAFVDQFIPHSFSANSVGNLTVRVFLVQDFAAKLFWFFSIKQTLLHSFVTDFCLQCKGNYTHYIFVHHCGRLP